MWRRERRAMADVAELGKLLMEHRARLLAMLQRRIDPALAVRLDPEDVLSEAFLLARAKWDRYCQQRRLTPYAWLYRIALDCLFEAWRRETRACRDQRRDMPWPERSSIQLGLGLGAGDTSPSEAAIREELR